MGLWAAGPNAQLCPPDQSCSASLFSDRETEAQLMRGAGPVYGRSWPSLVRVPAQEAAWLGARSGGGGLCESLLSPRRPQAGWVKGGCSPPASPPTWAQTMGLCARCGRVVKVRSPGPEPWPQPPRGLGGRARGSAWARKSSRQGTKASGAHRSRKPRNGGGGAGTHRHRGVSSR